MRWSTGEEFHAGDVIAKILRAMTKTKDITGGLPRVVELFEARKPRETAIIAEINGIVKYGEVSKGMRKLYIVGEDGVQKEYSIPRGVHINVQEGERVRSGDPLMDGPRIIWREITSRCLSLMFTPRRAAAGAGSELLGWSARLFGGCTEHLHGRFVG